MANDRRTELDRLERAALRLGPREREVLIFSAREHLSTDEIAARLAISRNTAERLLARAITKLDRALERQERPRWRLW